MENYQRRSNQITGGNMNTKSVGSAFFDLKRLCEEVRGRLIKGMIREVVGEAIQQSAYLVDDNDEVNRLVAEYAISVLQVTRVTEDVTQQIRNYCMKNLSDDEDMREGVKEERMKEMRGETEPVELEF